MPLPAPQLLLGNTQHAAHILARILLFGRGIEHAKILACAPEHGEEKSVSREFRRYFRSSCIHVHWRHTRGTVRILLVEDEPRVAGFIAKGLREQAYAVDVAPDGEEALYFAECQPIRLADSRRHAADRRTVITVCREAARHGRSHSHPHAHRARRRGRSRGGPGLRRRRLPHQALRLQGAPGASARALAASRRRPPANCSTSRIWRSIRPATRSHAPARPSASPPRNTLCSNS